MSPALPREERDAIKPRAAVHPTLRDREWLRYVEAIEDALDAAEEEAKREHREAVTWRDLARAEQDQRHALEQAANVLRSKVDRQAWSLRRAAEHRRRGDEARAALAAMSGHVSRALAWGLHTNPDKAGDELTAALVPRLLPRPHRPEGNTMSICISIHGEYSEHALDGEFTCTLCGVLDEDALRAELRDLRARGAERDRQVAERAGERIAQALRDAADRLVHEYPMRWAMTGRYPHPGYDGEQAENAANAVILGLRGYADEIARADSAAPARPTTDDRPVDMARAEEWVREAIENAIPDDLPGWRERYTDKAVLGVMAVLTAALASRPTTPTPTVSEEWIARHERDHIDAYEEQDGTCVSASELRAALGVAVTTDGSEG